MNCVSWNNCPSHALSLQRIPTFFMFTPVAGTEIGGGDDDDDDDEEDDDGDDGAEIDIGR